MKKIILSIAILFCSLGAWADGVTAKVSDTSLSIALTNETNYVAFQMDITLPTGVSASTINAVTRRLTNEGADNTIGSGKFIVTSNVYDATNNILRIIAYNLNNNVITGTSGDDILRITLSEAIDADDITISNIIFVKSDDLTKVDLSTVTSEQGGLLGDADGNTEVKMADAILVLQYILNNGDETKLSKSINKSNADVNSDGEIKLNDAISILKYSL